MASKRTPEQQERTAENRAAVVSLRRQRRTFAEIGHQLGFSAQRAYAVYREALAAVPVMEVTEHRAEELQLADDAVASLLPIATNPKQPRTAVEAWNSIRGWSERKARLLGLDAAVKIDARVSDEVSADIAELLDQMATLDAVEQRQALARETG